MPYKDPKKKKANMRRWWKENAEHIREYRAETKEHRSAVHRAWRLKNKDKRAEDMRVWREVPENRVASNLRSRIANVLSGRTKFFKLKEVVGCSLKELKAYLTALFLPGMSWQNYGDWEIDHIKPCVSFDFSKPKEQRACFHFSNLRPLWRADNRVKGSRHVL